MVGLLLEGGVTAEEEPNPEADVAKSRMKGRGQGQIGLLSCDPLMFHRLMNMIRWSSPGPTARLCVSPMGHHFNSWLFMSSFVE